MDELIKNQEVYYLSRDIVRDMRKNLIHGGSYNDVIAAIMAQCDVDEDEAEEYYEDAMEIIAYEEANGL